MHARSLTRIAVAAFACVFAVGLVDGDALAVIVCQHPKKRKVVRIEAGPACKRKRWIKVDDLDQRAAQIVDVVEEIGAACSQDPGRTFVPRQTIGTPPRENDGCRQFDGNESGCLAAFQVKYGTPYSCWFFKGRCLPCTETYESSLACMNTCQPASCSDGGKQYIGFCSRASDQNSCGQFFQLVSGGPEACWWTGTSCTPCRSTDAGKGSCSNPCGTPLHCASRSIGPRQCFMATSGPECDTWFGVDDNLPTTCWWDGNNCNECSLADQFALGRCQNGC
jgi:hypothetical protein